GAEEFHEGRAVGVELGRLELLFVGFELLGVGALTAEGGQGREPGRHRHDPQCSAHGRNPRIRGVAGHRSRSAGAGPRRPGQGYNLVTQYGRPGTGICQTSWPARLNSMIRFCWILFASVLPLARRTAAEAFLSGACQMMPPLPSYSTMRVVYSTTRTLRLGNTIGTLPLVGVLPAAKVLVTLPAASY